RRVDRHLDDFVERRARGLYGRLHVLEARLGLLDDVAADELSCLRVRRRHAGDEYEPVRLDGCRERDAELLGQVGDRRHANDFLLHTRLSLACASTMSIDRPNLRGNSTALASA